MPLNSLYARRYPLIAAVPDPAEIADYTSWALGICAGLDRAVEAIHKRGIVINDLHMFNILIRPDDSVTLIDFEAAALISEGKRPALGNPGFMAPRDRTGFDIDCYSLACVKLAMFMPLTTLFALDRGKAEHVAEVIASTFRSRATSWTARSASSSGLGGTGPGERSGDRTGARQAPGRYRRSRLTGAVGRKPGDPWCWRSITARLRRAMTGFFPVTSSSSRHRSAGSALPPVPLACSMP